MRFVEGEHYVRDGDERTLLINYNFPRVVKGFEHVSVADFENRIYILKGKLYLTEGFVWDGASGPTRDRWFNGRSNAVRGPMAHDALYMATREWLGPYSYYKILERARDALYINARKWLGPLSKDNKREYKALQKAADDYFYDILKADGMPWWRRSLWYRTVRWLGFPHITGQKLDSERALAA